LPPAKLQVPFCKGVQELKALLAVGATPAGGSSCVTYRPARAVKTIYPKAQTCGHAPTLKLMRAPGEGPKITDSIIKTMKNQHLDLQNHRFYYKNNEKSTFGPPKSPFLL
jgi:hypothetical protein